MPTTASRLVVGAAVVATIALEVASLALGHGVMAPAQAVMYAVYAVVQVGAGAAVVWRYPSHRVGWLLVVTALFNAVFADAALAYGQRGAAEGWPAATLAELAGLTAWIVAASGLTLLFLWFPDGRLPDPRWRIVPTLCALGALLALPGWAFNPRLGSAFVRGVNPYARGSAATQALFIAGATLICLALVASIISLVVRFRGSRGVEREQLKWFVSAGAIAGVVLPVSVALWTVWPPIQVAAAASLMLLPLSASVAILRYHLYDVDLVISRTASYLLITALLTAAYAAVVLATSTLISSPVAAAMGALVVALGFRPVRDRVQDAVDRSFRRRSHETRCVMVDFVEQLRRGDASVVDLGDAVRTALTDEGAELRLRSTTGEVYDVTGRPCALELTSGRTWSSLDTGAQLAPVLVHRVGDLSLARDVLDAGRLAFQIAALQVELRRQLVELEASRTRIVSVANEERRRLARDLHDGAQQRLVTIGLRLRHVQHELNGSAPSDVHQTLDTAVTELANAIGDLRELAGGLRPAGLDDGLGSALRDLAARAPIPVRLDVSTERFTAELETAAYFIASEGLTNAVKHAHADWVALTVSRDGDSLMVSVDDDGDGGADVRRGTGLLGLADRARSHGGTLEIASLSGAGTHLTARLPCA